MIFGTDERKNIILNEKKARLEYFDIAKGIGILCVIAGHLGNVRINQFVYTFHMPLFFIISGFFISDKYDTNTYIYKKAKQLFKPYVFTCVVICIISIINNILAKDIAQLIGDLKYWILASIYGAGGNMDTLHYFPPIGAIWYLPAIFFAVCIVNALKNNEKCIMLIILISYIGYKTSQLIWLPLSVQAGMTASFFTYIGYYAKQKKILDKQINSVYMIGMFAVWGICIIYGGQLYMVQNYFGNGFLDVIGAICATYLIICFSKWISKYKIINQMLSFLGKNSLIILCVHLIELKMFPWSRISITLLQKYIYKIILISLLVAIINRIKILKRVFT